MKFAQFFETVHGYAPFPWQNEVSRRLEAGEDIDFVRVPTAAGKSALVDLAIYTALRGGRRRICFVVDRRIVVDDVHERAERIAKALNSNPAFAELKHSAGEIQIVRLRGGVYGDDDWVLYPDRLTILISTVDQIGSRLLFRGYGVSSRMAPVHAGFLGNGLLLIVDEAHLSQPFIETVEATIRYGADVRLIIMSATPHKTPVASVDLSDADRTNTVLAQRIRASKRAELKVADSGDRAFATAVVTESLRLSLDAEVVGVVVNRVATARQVFEVLAGMGKEVVLLTGRCRPYDRDALLAEWLPKVCVGRVRGGGQQRFVVATQTIEVGANLDFDAMVTESAPLSSLRQRCGRLDRLGELGNCHAVILHRVSRGMDSVYGEALPATWDWLTSVANESCVDFGIGALEHLMLSSPPPVDEPRHAPRLLPTHLHLMQQTGPLAPKIYVAPFLHGAARPSAEVSVVWRADLDHIHMSDWARAVAYRPPLNSETLELPLPAVRLWLADEIVGEVTDLVTHTASEVGQDMRPVLRWRGPDSTEVVQASALRPGDTVVVPASYGGCDKFGWSPRSKDAVSDIGDLCSAVAVKGHVVRLIEPLMGWADAHKKELSKLAEHYLDVLNSVDPIMGVDQSLLAEVEVAIRERISQIETPVVRALGTKYFLETYPGGLLFRRNRLEGIAGAITGGRAVALDAHVAGVAQWCQKLAEHHPECTPLTRAARFHDEGKRDGRFQVMLYGDPLLAALGPPLAKSGLRGSTALGSSWRASGLPNGFRHELVSLDTEPNLTSLERHLVGTHHGYGRPWFPRCEDASASGVAQGRLGSGWAEQFFTLNQKNGPWKVAGMESLLRAADARRSMEEQDDD